MSRKVVGVEEPGWSTSTTPTCSTMKSRFERSPAFPTKSGLARPVATGLSWIATRVDVSESSTAAHTAAMRSLDIVFSLSVGCWNYRRKRRWAGQGFSVVPVHLREEEFTSHGRRPDPGTRSLPRVYRSGEERAIPRSGTGESTGVLDRLEGSSLRGDVGSEDLWLETDEEPRSVSHRNNLQLHWGGSLRLGLMSVNDEAAHRDPEGRAGDHVARKVGPVVDPVIGHETGSGVGESRNEPPGGAGRDDRREGERFSRVAGRKRLIRGAGLKAGFVRGQDRALASESLL